MAVRNRLVRLPAVTVKARLVTPAGASGKACPKSFFPFAIVSPVTGLLVLRSAFAVDSRPPAYAHRFVVFRLTGQGIWGRTLWFSLGGTLRIPSSMDNIQPPLTIISFVLGIADPVPLGPYPTPCGQPPFNDRLGTTFISSLASR